MKKAVLKTLGIAYGLMFAQQFSGINAIIFYSETIFKLTGVDLDPLLQMVVFAVVQVIACVIAAALIDQVSFPQLNRVNAALLNQSLFQINLLLPWIYYSKILIMIMR